MIEALYHQCDLLLVRNYNVQFNMAGAKLKNSTVYLAPKH